ncbi:unnamed protein product (macronuclear) [Paramecium tetraurelia]|uniref:Transmembrane protein n=1 Tax=Paramecium tetraurelia TaxID=5888 RepID=A0EBC7_PARTE|nr:uncharacterized protein GSPATT00025328001 [Paramecium tetraurelia]CAK92594.1 unnamed protein product [Paramecium tetraurelia]|eukprot:XP_001459991.1 hypothetical protein (macronuclear) [Paramecium tetraurelia strain d4-2]
MGMVNLKISLLNQQIYNNWIQQSQKKHYQSNLMQLYFWKFKTLFQRKQFIKYQFKHMQDNFLVFYLILNSNIIHLNLQIQLSLQRRKVAQKIQQYQMIFLNIKLNFMKSGEITLNLGLQISIILNQLILTYWNLIFKATLQVLGQLIHFNQLFQILQFNIIPKKSGIVCQFNGTKKLQKYFDVTYIYVQCKDLDVEQNWNEDPNLSIAISCLDLNSQGECKDSKQQKISINSTQPSQVFPEATFQPYTIQAWIVIATKNSLSYTYKITIVYLEVDFKTLDIDYNNGYLVRPVNNYEDLKFTFNIPLQNRQYLLDYQVAIIYDFQLVTILRPQYYKYSFQLYDHYQQFNKGDKFNLKFLAQYTNDNIPVQADLGLILNQPPICRLRMLEWNIKALENHKMAINCEQSEDKPYLYQMKVFLFKDDFEEFQNKSSDNSLLFYGFQKSNNLVGYFPNAEINVILQILDQRGSITNIHQYQNISQNQIDCTNQTIEQLILREKIAWIFEIMINRQDELNCIKLKDELLKYIELGINSKDIYEKLLAHQTINLYKKLILKSQASKTSKRYLEQNQQNECYNNKSSLFINTNQEHFQKNSTNISSLAISSQKIEKQITNLIKLKVNMEKQNAQNNIIVNTESIMQIKNIVQMLSISVHLIDNQLLIISLNETSAENQEQVAIISEKLIILIDNITIHISDSVQVNGQVLLIQGQILKFQLQKLTKSKHNLNFQIHDDYLDNLITFIQKQQLIVYYNYYNLSQTYRTMLQIYLNRSDFEIDQNHYVKTILTNFLYTNPQMNQQELSGYYGIDLTELQYCDPLNQFSTVVEYNYQCINYIMENKFENCHLEMQEVNNQRAQLVCICKSIGNLFLIKSAHKTVTQNSTTVANQLQFDFSSIKLIDQAFLFVQSGVILSSFFVYFFLLYKDYNNQKDIDLEQSQSERQDTLERGQKVFGRKFYPGHIFMFKAAFKVNYLIIKKHIHSILQFFQDEESNVKKSFRFLLFSNQLSILILISIWEVLASNLLIINAQINLLILLGVRAISKIIQAIYQLGGKIAIAMVLLYFCLPVLYLFLTIIVLNQIELNKTDMDVQITLNLLSTLFLVFFIVDPISIYIRIVLYKTYFNSVKNNEYIPINHFIYFFLHHSRINKIYEQLQIR